jgi:hypothetical protein
MDQQNVLSYLDSYCERAGDGALLAEPLNLFTNLCFIVAAIFAARLLLKNPGNRRLDLWLLVLFLFAIGIGSGLWHAVPTGHTVLMDVIPITLFINVYLVSALRRLLGFSWNKVVFWWFVYFAAGIGAQYVLPPDLLNGTIMYVPTFLTLAILTWVIAKRDSAVGSIFKKVLLVWLASLAFRTIDPEICAAFPYGTHFLWHCLNAWVLYRLLKVLIARHSA